jgi:hypothetical protein
MAVASRYIQDTLDPQRTLDDVLRRGTIHNDKRGPEATLDDLYLGILQRTSALTDSVILQNAPTGLDALLGLSEDTLRYPLTLRDVSQLRLTSSTPLINALGSILHINDKGLVRVLHASIIDFFTSSNFGLVWFE